jgi:hypothetical protein
MVDFISEEFSRICKNAIERFSSEFECPKEDVCLTFNLREETLFFRLLKDFKIVREVTFNEILNQKIDLRGYGLMVKPFITKCLFRFCQEHDIKQNDVSVMVLVVQEKICLVLYNKVTQVKQINIEELF